MEEVLKEGKTMGNIRIIIDGCCSMRKSDVARNIGKTLKEMSFGKVSVTGTDYKGDYYKGVLMDDIVEIQVVPEKMEIPPDFKGNREFIKQQRERNRITLNEEIK